MKVKPVMHSFIKYLLTFDSLIHTYLKIITVLMNDTNKNTIIPVIKKFQPIKLSFLRRIYYQLICLYPSSSDNAL